MKLLSFERELLLDTVDCPRCSGSGQFSHAPAGQSSVCYNCRGWGRKATSDALQLFYAICDLLNAPMSQVLREGRVEPKHLDRVFGRDLIVGMKVRPLSSGPTREWPEVITEIENVGLDSKRLTFADKSRKLVSAFDLLDRELTTEEVDRVQAFMREHLGRGAVERSAA